MDVKLDKWHKCKVDIEILKELSKKSDIKGLQHISLFFGLLILTGSLAYLTSKRRLIYRVDNTNYLIVIKSKFN